MAKKHKVIVVTGSSGLVGSEAVTHFDRRGARVLGLDTNMRADFFGPQGDTTWNLERLRGCTQRFEHYSLDIRKREEILDFYKTHRPDATIHCAGQPSHDLAKDRPFDDFDVNTVGTINLLEATRCYAKDSPFIFMSTNKVYGDAPNELPLVELEQRYDYREEKDYEGISETCRIDRCLHSLFGASKASADIITQEYGRYFDMPTVCFRAGCVTGPSHSGVELHGFLSYLVKVAQEDKEYTIFGYKGKQVRDQIHSEDVINAMDAFLEHPRCGEVYNMGGGRESNASLLECIELIEQRLGRKLRTTYVEANRLGDHICYISDLSKFKGHYPNWGITRFVEDVIDECLAAN